MKGIANRREFLRYGLLATGLTACRKADETPPLPPQKLVTDLTGSTFDDTLHSKELRDKVCIVEVGAPWCPPCRDYEATLVELEKRGPLKHIRFFRVTQSDADAKPIAENAQLCARLKIRSLPTLLIYVNGAAIQRAVGGVRREAFIEGVQKLDQVTEKLRAPRKK